jgi:6-pyruvoyl-tetrahydropterin synthase
MSDINTLVIDSQELQAAQYLPDHTGHCVYLHGHTYVISKIEIDVQRDVFLDFGRIKAKIKEWDHAFFVPHRFLEQWQALERATIQLGCKLNLVAIPGDPTVEEIAYALVRHLKELAPNAIVRISFRITEGLHQGVLMQWRKEE